MAHLAAIPIHVHTTGYIDQDRQWTSSCSPQSPPSLASLFPGWRPNWAMADGPKHNGPSRATHSIALPQAAIKLATQRSSSSSHSSISSSVTRHAIRRRSAPRIRKAPRRSKHFYVGSRYTHSSLFRAPFPIHYSSQTRYSQIARYQEDSQASGGQPAG